MEKIDMPERPSKGAWVSVWMAFGAGIGASLAANIAHAGAGAGARAVAGWAPLALLLCSEVMTRVPAPRHPWLRAVQVVGTVIVAGVAALASYRHMRGLALDYGEDNLTASTLPLSVDGLVLVASIGLVELSRMRRAAIAAERAAALAAALPPPPASVPTAAAAVQVPAAGPTAAAESAAVAVPEPTAAAEPAAVAELEPPAPEPVPVSAVDPDPDLDPAPRSLPLPRLEPVVPPEPWPQQQALPLPEPPRSPDPVPVPPDAATEELWAAAREAWKDSAAAGEPLTGLALGQRFGRSERWGRQRIAEAKAEIQAEQEAAGDVAGETDQQHALTPAGAGAE